MDERRQHVPYNVEIGMTDEPGDPVTWLRAQLDEDEWWAREASRSDVGYTATGEHWRWEGETTDQPVLIDPMYGDVVEGENHEPIGLRSVEQYPARAISANLVHLVILGQEEIEPAVAGHIARWDPARVLAEVDAKRQRIERLIGLEHEMGAEGFPTYDSCRLLVEPGALGDLEVGYCSCGLDAWRNQLFRFEAMPYADRPGCPEEWRS